MRSPHSSRWMPVLVTGLLLLVAATASAQGAYNYSYMRKGTFAIGGGFNAPVGKTADYLNSSGTMMIAAGRNLNRRLTIEAEWTHNWLAVAPEVIQRAQSDSIQFDDVHASMWSITLNGIYRLNDSRDITPWVIGGVGYYKRTLQLTQTAYYYYPPVWDPWWGWVDGGWGPGEAVAGERSDAVVGFNVGAGIDFAIENDAKLFLDVRYHHADTHGVKMDVIPIQAGIRW